MIVRVSFERSVDRGTLGWQRSGEQEKVEATVTTWGTGVVEMAGETWEGGGERKRSGGNVGVVSDGCDRDVGVSVMKWKSRGGDGDSGEGVGCQRYRVSGGMGVDDEVVGCVRGVGDGCGVTKIVRGCVAARVLWVKGEGVAEKGIGKRLGWRR